VSPNELDRIHDEANCSRRRLEQAKSNINEKFEEIVSRKSCLQVFRLESGVALIIISDLFMLLFLLITHESKTN